MKRKNKKTGHLQLRKKTGFTYIELIVVVVILSILIGLSIPQFKKTFAYFELENFTINIYFLFNYLQSDSISNAKIHCLIFYEETKEFKPYFLKEDGGWELFRERSSRLYKVPDRITLKITPQEKNKILFYPDGSIDNITIKINNDYGHEHSLIIKGIIGGIKIQ